MKCTGEDRIGTPELRKGEVLERMRQKRLNAQNENIDA